jgi:intein/homing endonuclease
MAAKVNEIITGEYDHTGKAIVYGDTDSVAADSVICTQFNDRTIKQTIEELFLKGNLFWKEGDKEYSCNNNIQVAHCGKDGKLDYVKYNYVYRHKVSKGRYRIKTANGKEVIVTEDHSVMVLQGEDLVEKKPAELIPGDKVITIISNDEYQADSESINSVS